jgi:hypothetical protein
VNGPDFSLWLHIRNCLLCFFSPWQFSSLAAVFLFGPDDISGGGKVTSHYLVLDGASRRRLYRDHPNMIDEHKADRFVSFLNNLLYMGVRCPWLEWPHSGTCMQDDTTRHYRFEQHLLRHKKMSRNHKNLWSIITFIIRPWKCFQGSRILDSCINIKWRLTYYTWTP